MLRIGLSPSMMPSSATRAAVRSAAVPGLHWDLATLAHGFGVAYRVCQRCQTQDPTRSAIDRILEARYGRP